MSIQFADVAGRKLFSASHAKYADGTYTFTLTGTSNGITRTATGQLTVTVGTFAGSVSPTAATIAVGSSQSFSVQVNGAGGFQGQVNLSCVSASGLTCQLTPTQVTLPANGSSTRTLEITVGAKPAVVPFDFAGGLERLRVPVFFAMILLGALIGGTIWVLKEYPGNRRPAWRSAILLAGLAMILGIASCGGGGSVGGGGSGDGGNGGGGGGGATITIVTVEGSAGGTVVSLGSVSVATP